MHRSKPRIAILVLCAMALPYQPSVAASRVYETERPGDSLRELIVDCKPPTRHAGTLPTTNAET